MKLERRTVKNKISLHPTIKNRLRKSKVFTGGGYDTLSKELRLLIDNYNTFRKHAYGTSTYYELKLEKIIEGTDEKRITSLPKINKKSKSKGDVKKQQENIDLLTEINEKYQLIKTQLKSVFEYKKAVKEYEEELDTINGLPGVEGVDALYFKYKKTLTDEIFETVDDELNKFIMTHLKNGSITKKHEKILKKKIRAVLQTNEKRILEIAVKNTNTILKKKINESFSPQESYAIFRELISSHAIAINPSANIQAVLENDINDFLTAQGEPVIIEMRPDDNQDFVGYLIQAIEIINKNAQFDELKKKKLTALIYKMIKKIDLYNHNNLDNFKNYLVIKKICENNNISIDEFLEFTPPLGDKTTISQQLKNPPPHPLFKINIQAVQALEKAVEMAEASLAEDLRGKDEFEKAEKNLNVKNVLYTIVKLGYNNELIEINKSRDALIDSLIT